MDLKLNEVNDQAIKQWKQSTPQSPVTHKTKEKKVSNGLCRPPQVKDIRARGKSCTQVVFMKKHGRYLEQAIEQAAPKYGYAGGVNDLSEISPEKAKQIATIDRTLESLHSNKPSGNTVCRCGLKH